MTIQKYDWVSKDTKLNANGWSVPLRLPHNDDRSHSVVDFNSVYRSILMSLLVLSLIVNLLRFVNLAVICSQNQSAHAGTDLQPSGRLQLGVLRSEFFFGGG